MAHFKYASAKCGLFEFVPESEGGLNSNSPRGVLEVWTDLACWQQCTDTVGHNHITDKG